MLIAKITFLICCSSDIILILTDVCGLTAGVTRWWVGRDNAILTEPALSQKNCLKARRLPPPWPRRSLPGIGCTSRSIPQSGAVLLECSRKGRGGVSLARQTHRGCSGV